MSNSRIYPVCVEVLQDSPPFQAIDHLADQVEDFDVNLANTIREFLRSGFMGPYGNNVGDEGVERYARQFSVLWACDTRLRVKFGLKIGEIALPFFEDIHPEDVSARELLADVEDWLMGRVTKKSLQSHTNAFVELARHYYEDYTAKFAFGRPAGMTKEEFVNEGICVDSMDLICIIAHTTGATRKSRTASSNCVSDHLRLVESQGGKSKAINKAIAWQIATLEELLMQAPDE